MSETATELKVEGREGGCGTIDDDDDEVIISGASVEATRHETKPKMRARAVAGCAHERALARGGMAVKVSCTVHNRLHTLPSARHTQNASIYDICNYEESGIGG